MLQSFQNFTDAEAIIETFGSDKVVSSPTRSDIVARSESECAKCSGTGSTFVSQIPIVTVHVLHGEP